jgi:TPP-dependent 2-oxoacid decarboxylase
MLMDILRMVTMLMDILRMVTMLMDKSVLEDCPSHIAMLCEMGAVSQFGKFIESSDLVLNIGAIMMDSVPEHMRL